MVPRGAEGALIGMVGSVGAFRSVREQGALLGGGGLEGQRDADRQIWRWPLRSCCTELW